MRVSLIVAISENGVIGRGGDLPWRLSADLRRFKKLTMGHTIVMGRKTFESIGRSLPGRTSVVVTRQPQFKSRGALLAHSLDEALSLAGNDEEAFIIGGAEIYRQALDRVDRIYMTRVHAEIEGDTHFPPFDQRHWQLVEQSRHEADENNETDYSFRVYDRIHNPTPA